ncbi:hypothetical protein B566_EDAN009610 [Ephemera danica]|nr:hypothetical protein B566_EDAN009610 [Ephemera danica]
MKMICQLLLALLCFVLVKSVPSVREIDPKDIVVIQNITYYFSPTSETLLDSMLICTDVGMSLIGFDTETEYNDVQSHINSTGTMWRQYWTSGSKVGSDWVWSTTGLRTNFFDWEQGEPDELGDSNQAYIYLYNTNMWDWSDTSSTMFFICKRRPCTP